MALPAKALLLIGQKMKDKGLVSKAEPEVESDEDSEGSPHEERLLECAEHLIEGVKAGDAKAVADAFKEMFECCEMMPHEEGEHLGEDSEY